MKKIKAAAKILKNKRQTLKNNSLLLPLSLGVDGPLVFHGSWMVFLIIRKTYELDKLASRSIYPKQNGWIGHPFLKKPLKYSIIRSDGILKYLDHFKTNVLSGNVQLAKLLVEFGGRRDNEEQQIQNNFA